MAVRPCTTQEARSLPAGALGACCCVRLGRAGDAHRHPAQCRRHGRPGHRGAGRVRAQRLQRLGHSRPGRQLDEQRRCQLSLGWWWRRIDATVIRRCDPWRAPWLRPRARCRMARSYPTGPTSTGRQRVCIPHRAPAGLHRISPEGARLVEWRRVSGCISGRVGRRDIHRYRGAPVGCVAASRSIPAAAWSGRRCLTRAPPPSCVGERQHRADRLADRRDRWCVRAGGTGRGRSARPPGDLDH